MHLRRAAIGTLTLTVTAALTACGGASSTSSTTSTSSVAAPAASSTAPEATTAPETAAAPETTTAAGTSDTTAPEATATTDVATTQPTTGVASGEPHPSAGRSTGTKQDAGISPQATATVGLEEFCGSLKAASWKPADLTTLETTTKSETIQEIVDRMERLAGVTPPPELQADWRASVDGFDDVAQKVEDAPSDAAVPGIIKTEMARSEKARQHVVEVAKPCR